MAKGQPQYAGLQVQLMGPLADFTGGLNLRADAFQLGPNETPESLDVDVQIGGGIAQRRVVTPFASVLPSPALNLWAYTTPSVEMVIAQAGTKLFTSSGSTWSLVSMTALSAGKVRGVVFDNDFYGVCGNQAPLRFDGTTLTRLTQTWNETTGGEGANDGNMPFATLICAHMGRVFIAGTFESGTAHPNRIRWSHANKPEDWRQEDFIDIDIGRDGDVITAIVEFQEKLYIFKQESISVLSGYGPENFQVVPLSQDIGAVSQEAVCITDVGLFNFSWPQGVYLDKGTGPYPIFDKVWPLIRDDTIPAAYRTGISMGWVNNVLMCSIPYGASTVNARTLVYNPWIFKNRYLRFLQGPWYLYSFGVNAFVRYNQPNANTLFLGASSTLDYVAQLEQSGGQDDWGSGATDIAAYYRTRWFDANQPSVIKRWRAPDIVTSANGSASILVEVKRDYDPSNIYTTFQIQQSPTLSGTLIWDDGTGTVGGVWDDGTGTVGGTWAGVAYQGENITRGAWMGPARSVQLSFFGPAGVAWSVDAITFKTLPKKVRG